MLFLKGLLATFAVASAFVNAEADISDKHKRPFNNPAACGMTPFLYAKVNRGLIDIVLNVAANLPCDISAQGSKAFFQMIDRLIEANPCREDARALALFMAKQPRSVSTDHEAKVLAQKLNNFFFKSIDQPTLDFEIMNKNFKPTFTLGQSDAVFDFLHLVAMKLPNILDAQTGDLEINVMQSISSMLPGNKFSIFLLSYMKENPPQVSSGDDFRQYICAMHNAYSASNFLFTINCANLDKYYGPNTNAW